MASLMASGCHRYFTDDAGTERSVVATPRCASDGLLH
jgi:hypothetical protein